MFSCDESVPNNVIEKLSAKFSKVSLQIVLVGENVGIVLGCAVGGGVGGRVGCKVGIGVGIRVG